MWLRCFCVCAGLLALLGCEIARLDMQGFPCRFSAQCGALLVCHKSCDGCMGRCGREGDQPEGLAEPTSEVDTPDEPGREPTEDAGEPQAIPEEPSPERHPEPVAELSPEPVPEDLPGPVHEAHPETIAEAKPCLRNCTWVLPVKSSGDTFPGYGIARDRQGNIYFGGFIYAQTSIGGRPLAPRSKREMYIAKVSTQGNVVWATPFPRLDATTSSHVGAVPTTLLMGPQDQLYVAGKFEGKSQFDAYTKISVGSSDAFVLRMDTSGKVLWVQVFGGRGIDDATSLALTASGDVIVAGLFQQDLIMGTKTYQTSGDINTFVARLSAKDGALQWSTAFQGGSLVYPLNGSGIHVDAQDRVAVSGTFSKQDMVVGQQTLTYPHGSGATIPAGFVAWLDAGKGVVDKTLALSATGQVVPLSLVGLADGTLYISGYLEGTGNLAGASVTSTNDTTGTPSSDGFVLKLGSDGKAAWVTSMGGSLGDWAVSLALAPQGGVFVAGFFQGKCQLGNQSYTTQGQHDTFIARLSDKGVVTWSMVSGGVLADSPRGILLAEPGYGLVIGYFRATASFGVRQVTSDGGADAYLWKWQYP